MSREQAMTQEESIPKQVTINWLPGFTINLEEFGDKSGSSKEQEGMDTAGGINTSLATTKKGLSDKSLSPEDELIEISDECDQGFSDEGSVEESEEEWVEESITQDWRIYTQYHPNMEVSQNDTTSASDLIDFSEYAIVQFQGVVQGTDMSRRQIVKRGKLTPRQREFFKKFNAISMDSDVVPEYVDLSPNTLKKYSYQIANYLLFLASKENIDKIRVDGKLMFESVSKKIKDSVEKGKKVLSGLEQFKASLNLMNRMLVTYKRSVGFRVKHDEIPELDFYDEEMGKIVGNVEKRVKRKPTDAAVPFIAELLTKDDNLSKIMLKQYQRTGVFLVNNSQQIKGLNGIMEILMSHHLIFSGKNKRLCLLSHFNLDLTGKKRIVFYLVNDKTGILEKQFPAVRSKHVETCLISAVALSLWYQFDFEGGQFYGENRPEFIDSDDWGDLKLLWSPSSRVGSSVSSTFQLHLLKDCLKAINIDYNKKTRIGKTTNARQVEGVIAEADKIPDDGSYIRRVSRKVVSAATSDYLKFASGFGNHEHYHIPRSKWKVPFLLKDYVFPWLEDVIEERTYGRRLTESPRDNFHLDTFIKLFKWLRIVILQDLVALDYRLDKKTHPITEDTLRSVIPSYSDEEISESSDDESDVNDEDGSERPKKRTKLTKEGTVRKRSKFKAKKIYKTIFHTHEIWEDPVFERFREDCARKMESEEQEAMLTQGTEAISGFEASGYEESDVEEIEVIEL